MAVGAGHPGANRWKSRVTRPSFHCFTLHTAPLPFVLQQVQLRGRKRFLLFPPHAWTVLGVFPFVHPSHAQAAANVSDLLPSLALPDVAGGAAAAPAAEVAWAHEAGLVVADLAPGDMLYLPPLWFHHVVAVRLPNS